MLLEYYSLGHILEIRLGCALGGATICANIEHYARKYAKRIGGLHMVSSCGIAAGEGRRQVCMCHMSEHMTICPHTRHIQLVVV